MKGAIVSASLTDVRQPIAHWHSLTVEECHQQLDAHRNGLTAEVAADRLALYGPNELVEQAGRSPLQILWDQFANIMLLMLLAVAVVSGALDLRDGQFPKDAIAILVIAVLNAVLGYLQESRAEKALAALKGMAAPLVRVRRDNRDQEIPVAGLVPGDLILLEAGDQVPADARLVESANLQVKESALPGEAEAVQKLADQQLPTDVVIGDRTNCLFQGTEVLQGRGQALVYATGMNTELGRIATLLQSVESEKTPLQQRLDKLGNVLVSGALILVAIVVGLGVLNGQSWEDLLSVGLSMAVAIVPEGLPAVITVALAIGTQRMVQRESLIRRLPAVETLGSVTTICSDKTGTLTQNKMVVQQIHTLDHDFTVTGEGYVPAGHFLIGGEIIVPNDYRDLMLLLAAGAVCNDAALVASGEHWSIVGDPTEGSLLTVAAKAGIDPEGLQRVLPRQDEIPFTSERKRMSVVVADLGETTLTIREGQPYVLFVKGSAELILERCQHCFGNAQLESLTAATRQQILAAGEAMASAGMRVLGFAYRPSAIADVDEDAETDLTWLGLMGQIDAPRPEVREAVQRCRQAGIRTLMITGDHPLTAQAIARDLGITEVGHPVLTGQQLSAMNGAELDAAVRSVEVYARVAPEHKLRIVESLQRQGEFVAMTGDGVNDAPALKQANIGVAMGITGTDVSKEASDMVLLDDNFATIVAAVEEGRIVYGNIRKFIKYILGSNIGELLTIASAPLLGLGAVPLTPLQILWMNLVTDGIPALALAVEPGDPTIMQRRPHNPQESIFARGLGTYMLRVGVVFSAFTIVLMVIAYQYTQVPLPGLDPKRWQTMVFTTLCLAQMGHAIPVRSDLLTIQTPMRTNPWLWLSVIVTALLQLALVYVSPLQKFFGTHSLSQLDLAICLGFSLLLFVYLEAEKWVRQRRY
ncbi:cation-transporting ATPase PacL homolog [Synechococcus elongatus PCC 6301]|uniref:Cation-transporting ATPase PacL homolog n=1 Tax=Synechococcus sp. (strain ATCC 27144 / PCC 6301 / SAUG 1402/1) TaxID=269084 RepID=A0A0H3K3G8_SYNP6|nr:cation-translocating P-type ATPase [Synechococcus elongatus]BAD78657.1 cation-transporting ATPase PacL homolog [Synechococcus elongatus PCC 6301]